MHIIDMIALGTLFFLAGFIMGRLFLAFQINKEIHKLSTENKEPVDGIYTVGDKEVVLEEYIAKCIVEKVDNTYFLYEQDTQKYMAHANSIDELAKFAQKNNNVDYAVVSFYDEGSNSDLFWFHNGEVQKL